jgi:hypothetical protein
MWIWTLQTIKDYFPLGEYTRIDLLFRDKFRGNSQSILERVLFYLSYERIVLFWWNKIFRMLELRYQILNNLLRILIWLVNAAIIATNSTTPHTYFLIIIIINQTIKSSKHSSFFYFCCSEWLNWTGIAFAFCFSFMALEKMKMIQWDKSLRGKLMEERNFNKKIFEWKFRYSKVHNLFHFLWILF